MAMGRREAERCRQADLMRLWIDEKKHRVDWRTYIRTGAIGTWRPQALPDDPVVIDAYDAARAAAKAGQRWDITAWVAQQEGNGHPA